MKAPTYQQVLNWLEDGVLQKKVSGEWRTVVKPYIVHHNERLDQYRRKPG